jgi:deazaflavin-dependent oxidoreductase (nitroreductase family)
VLRADGVIGRRLRGLGSRSWARLFFGPKVLTRMDRLAHRVTGGRLRFADLLFESLMLTTTGRRSGEPRTVPLAAFDLDGVPVVIASNFGREDHPAWSHNLTASPRATVERRGERFAVTARPLTPSERDRVWPRAIEVWPGYATYRETTRGIRDIRMYALERDAPSP